jgi:hypothetical protein
VLLPPQVPSTKKEERHEKKARGLVVVVLLFGVGRKEWGSNSERK